MFLTFFPSNIQVKVKKRQRSNVSVRRGVKMAELALPPLEASGISIQVQETDHAGNNGLLTEVEVYTEPPCNWVDGETLITCLTSAALPARGVRLLAVAGCTVSNQFALQAARGMRGGSWTRLRLPRRRS